MANHHSIDNSSLRGSNIFIITNSFMDFKSNKIVIGGTETYTDALLRIANRHGCRSVVLQKSNTPLHFKIGENSFVSSWRSRSELTNILESSQKTEKAIYIFYQYEPLPHVRNISRILIQHGIGNDGTADPLNRHPITRKLADIRRRIRYFGFSRDSLKICSSFCRIVCVDTNFINAVRTAWPMYDWEDHLVYIPNFADRHAPGRVKNKWQNQDSRLVVLFARRFALHRGVYLWLESLKKLTVDFPEVEFRVVGFGEAEARLNELSRVRTNLRVYARPYAEMPEEHLSAHVSVIPSLWSEGTSLACIESMAAGCAVIASNVGGLCNLVVPGYNGLLIPPVEEEFTNAVSQLLSDRKLAMEFGMRAYDMAQVAFSRELWEQRMTEVLVHALRYPNLGMPKRRMRPFPNVI